MQAPGSPTPTPFAVAVFCILGLSFLVGKSHAQVPKTNATEAAALDAIFKRWQLKRHSPWDAGGDPCAGPVTSPINFDRREFNPAVMCVCSYIDRRTCHVTGLKIFAMNISGEIPGELENLIYLEKLFLDRNFLTGQLPPFLGRLTSMKYMSLSVNALHGPIPRELGNLDNLIALALGTNNFSGSLPAELGNLSNLEELHVDSCGLSGEIPSTFAWLSKMKTLWASDNNFIGKIPDFIGNWTHLTTLLLQGNNFQGPIPSSFSNLNNMLELRLGDITGGSSQLTFIGQMKSLNVLVLRNCKISGTILPNFDEYKSLTILDLSFNNLTGQIPRSLFNSESLIYLFLGNNSLSGDLPTHKSPNILNIDLSYNELSGRLPSWVENEVDLKLNLVANKFALDSTKSSSMLSGLHCLQKDFPCGRSPPTHSSFAIQCGGSRTMYNDTIYDADGKDLSIAAYYVTETLTWGVSNAGLYIGRPNSSNFGEYSDFSLRARGSPSSLRYYGLGLVNGNYSIKLVFSEIVFESTPTWASLGRRIFDIYIQGILVAKDFNIRREAGEASFRTVPKTYLAQVTDNYLEIHLFWSGKGTCCVPDRVSYGPLITAISVFSYDFVPSTLSQNKSHTALLSGILASTIALALLSFFGALFWIKRRKRLTFDVDEALGVGTRVETFCYADLKTATDGFRSSNKLGGGGFGLVFKGELADGRSVAVKQLSEGTKHGKMQFLTEIGTISAVQHRNLVKLYGYCIEGDRRFLVYEYLENKSLDQALFGKSGIHLDWKNRFAICLGTARGLAYLHEESSVRIIHRDVKSSNILLDTDLNPKLSDFGLAKLYDDEKTHMNTGVAGTVGYLAPEYAMIGHLTEKVDVFGFGVVALEILSGKHNSCSKSSAREVFLLEWAWHLHENNCELEMVDPSLSSCNQEEAIRLFHVALLCTQMSPILRPSMSRVVAMLAGDVPITKMPSRPACLVDWGAGGMGGFTTITDFPSSTITATSSSVQTNASADEERGILSAHPPPSSHSQDE